MKLTTAFILVVTLLMACNRTSPETHINNEGKRIDSYLKEVVDRQQIPGLTLAVTRNDTVIYTGAFGFRNIETREPMKTNYDFHWASVSKTFVATAILQLVEKGRIKLDEKLVTYVPYFKQK